MEWIYLILIAGLVLVVAYRTIVGSTVVMESERGLMYKDGKFMELMEPGVHRYLARGVTVRKVDIRPRVDTISGQEIVSSDGVSLKVSVAMVYGIENPEIAINKVQSFAEHAYLQVQIALREIVGAVDIDTALSTRADLSQQLFGACEAPLAEIGLKLVSVDIKDVMFPGKLKELFAQVVNARKEGQAVIEKARGESAALRNLANSARLFETNPQLMNLRLLQTMVESSGNTFVLDWSDVPKSKGINQNQMKPEGN